MKARPNFFTKLFLVPCALVLSFTASLSAQYVQPAAEGLAKLDETIESHMKKYNIPGVLVAVASQGKLRHLKTYGWANVELRVPVSDSTVFEIGSISKQFVAAAVMQLVQENKLKLDDLIHKYLPYLPSEWLGVTIRQLLTHTSGIPDYEEIRSYDVYRFRMTPEEVIKIAHSRPMDFAPGTGWYYSNTGYFLLSMIVERVDGHPLGPVLHDRIFAPLKMDHTRFADPEAIIANRAAGYWVNKTGDLINRNPTETTSTLGAGGLLTTVHDLVKWDAALYGESILSTASKNAMWTPAILPNRKNTEYGFGWRVSPYKGLKSQSHSGQVAGFVSSFSRFPEQKLVFFVFHNRYRAGVRKIKIALLHTFMPSLGPIPE